MGARGPASSASLSVIGPSGVESLRRPSPPDDLTPEQAAEWTSIVNGLPAEWFRRETHPILACYCREVVRSKQLAQIIENYWSQGDFDVKSYRDLLRSEAEVSRTIAMLATKMRICQQSTYDKSVKKPQMIDRPWKQNG
jgi:hypothetical protein